MKNPHYIEAVYQLAYPHLPAQKKRSSTSESAPLTTLAYENGDKASLRTFTRTNVVYDLYGRALALALWPSLRLVV